MRKVSKILILCLILILIVSCGKSKDNKKIRIVLDWVPNTNHTGLYVAKDLGYFKEEGVDVEIVQPPEGSTTALIGAGGAEFGISFQDTLAKSFAKENPVPVTAVAAILQHNTSGIISLKEKGIDSPKKLEGKRYATWEDDIEQAILKKLVTDNGGGFFKIKINSYTVKKVVFSFKKNIYSIWGYFSWGGNATEKGGIKKKFFKICDYGKGIDYYNPVIISKKD